jgi:hypothetical protein
MVIPAMAMGPIGPKLNGSGSGYDVSFASLPSIARPGIASSSCCEGSGWDCAVTAVSGLWLLHGLNGPEASKLPLHCLISSLRLLGKGDVKPDSVLSCPALLERRFGWAPDVMAWPIREVAPSRPWLVGRGESPENPVYIAGGLLKRRLGMVALRGRVGEVSGWSSCPSGSSFDKVGCEASPRLIWLRGREFDRWGEIALSAAFDNAMGS